MRCEAVLRAMGQSIAKTQNSRGVPEKFCAKWEAGWQELVDLIKNNRVSVDEGVERLELHSRRMVIAQFIWEVTEERVG